MLISYTVLLTTSTRGIRSGAWWGCNRLDCFPSRSLMAATSALALPTDRSSMSIIEGKSQGTSRSGFGLTFDHDLISSSNHFLNDYEVINGDYVIIGIIKRCQLFPPSKVEPIAAESVLRYHFRWNQHPVFIFRHLRHLV